MLPCPALPCCSAHLRDLPSCRVAFDRVLPCLSFLTCFRDLSCSVLTCRLLPCLVLLRSCSLAFLRCCPAALLSSASLTSMLGCFAWLPWACHWPAAADVLLCESRRRRTCDTCCSVQFSLSILSEACDTLPTRSKHGDQCIIFVLRLQFC